MFKNIFIFLFSFFIVGCGSTAITDNDNREVNQDVNLVMPSPIGIDDNIEVYQNSSIFIYPLTNDLNTLSIKNLSSPSHGKIKFFNNYIEYTPNRDYFGSDIITYIPNNVDKDGQVTKITINVIKELESNIQNRPPKGTIDNIEVDENSYIDVNLIANDSDEDANTLTVTNLTTPIHGTATFNGFVVRYKPNLNYIGEDRFTYTPNDGKSDGFITTVYVNVKSVNLAPTGVTDSFIVDKNSSLIMDVLENDIDVDNDRLLIDTITTPNHGVARIENNKIHYQPNINFIGEDIFSYSPNDGKATGELVQITITVIDTNNTYLDRNSSDNLIDNIADLNNTDTQEKESINHTPISFADTTSTYFNQPVTIFVLENDIDEDNDTLSISYVSDTKNGSITIRDNRMIYTPNNNFVGEDSFEYSITDGNSTSNISDVTIKINGGEKLFIRGQVTYQKVDATENGLDYKASYTTPCKAIKVALINSRGDTIATTYTDMDGLYVFEDLDRNQALKVRVYAHLYDVNRWDIKVVDNTNNDALYVMEGELRDVEEMSTIRNLHASIGWDIDSNRYISDRVSAPFAILDTVYKSLKVIYNMDNTISFSPLEVKWSPQNKAVNGDKSIGEIGSSHYDSDGSFWILGDENSDTDEFDISIVTHEFGHYLKSQLSRKDSIGGRHSTTATLDTRLAYEEGWCNAFAGIIENSPLFIDTVGRNQNLSSVINLQSDGYNKGWFSEGSVNRIIYNLFDDDNSGSDTLSLGFKPLFDVATKVETKYPSFLTIFSFIYALKIENPSILHDIDKLVLAEDIAPINNYFGSNRTNNAGESKTLPVYNSISIDEKKTFCLENKFGSYNRLLNRALIKLHISSSDYYEFTIVQKSAGYTSTLNGDPDFILYKTSPHLKIGMSNNIAPNEERSFDLSAGDYLIDLYDYNKQSKSCFELTIKDISWFSFYF